MTFPLNKIVIHRLSKSPLSEQRRTPTSRDATGPDALPDASIWACSVKRRSDADEDRMLLSDRKSYLSQLRPRPLIISTMRVVAMQGSTILSKFLKDQLQIETEREELVQKGKLSPHEADRLNQMWEQKEWTIRWGEFPRRVVHGIVKFHAVTLVMRCYEYVAAKLFDDVTLDKLTQDPFQAAVRASKRTDKPSDLWSQMLSTCLWSNIIAFLADFSVHQVILGYACYQYHRGQKRRLIQKRHTQKVLSDREDTGPILISFVFKSTKMFVCRSFCLGAAAMGGAIGSAFYPGWGTTLGSQFGDGLMGAAFDDIS